MRKLIMVSVLLLSACSIPTAPAPDTAVEVVVVCTLTDDMIDRCVAM